MPYYTPLRYPGGKRRLAPAVMRLLEANRLQDVEYVEPYAGGAAVALALLFGEYASRVHINDLSRPVYAFWHSVLNETEELCKRIRRTRVSMNQWHKQRELVRNPAQVDLLDLGFATLFLNRTNRSGILGGGVIGGQSQSGKWALDARFNKENLIQRIHRIGRYRNRISLYQMDAGEFTSGVIDGLGNRCFVFYDPPYIENSEELYLNTYDLVGHKALAEKISKLDQPWIVTYDYAAVQLGLYRQRRLSYDLSYSAQGRYQGKEVMFIGDRLALPAEWTAADMVPLSASGSEHPVYGKMEAVESKPDMQEGPEAFERFRQAVKTVMAVPKRAVVKKPSAKKKKPTAQKS